MSVASGIEPQQNDGGAAPAWSGVPVVLGNSMILPLHIADTRQITFGPEWVHIDHWTNEGGDVEYHAYRRA